MRTASVSAWLFLSSFFPLTAAAVDLSGQSTTYLQSRESTDSSKLLPLYEYLDFKTEGIGPTAVSFNFGGWLRYDLRDASFGSRSASDLRYAYLKYNGDRGNTVLSLGRIPVNEGVASGLVDGIYARTDLVGGFVAAAFGGSPVEADFDNRSGDSVYGGRVGHGVQGIYRVGFSYLMEKNNHANFRKEEGVDLWFRPFGSVELLGTSSYNALTSDWMQHAYVLMLGPFSSLLLRTETTQVTYKDFFTSATTSAFRLQPGGPLDPNEKLSTVGEEVMLFLGQATLSAAYTKFDYHIAGNADAYGGKLAFSAPAGGMGLSLRRMSGETDRLRYYEYRAYGIRKFGRADLTVDVLAVRYDAQVNGVKNAYAASIAGGYRVTDRVRLAADFEYSHDPFFNKDIRGMLKLAYGLGSMPGSTGWR